MLRIEVSQQGQASQTYHFDKDRIQVGRGNDCDLILTAPGISTVHAQVVANEGRCVVIDQNSTNGTYLHGAPIHGPTKVMPYEGVYICSYCLHIECLPQQKTTVPGSAPVEPPMLGQGGPTGPTGPRGLTGQIRQPDPPAMLAEPSEETTTIAPNRDSAGPRRGASQKISVQPAAQPGSPKPSEHKIELRRWALPGAPAHASPDQIVLARVFAGLAQPFIESGRLPPGDEAARASFYALAQAQLSINLSPSSAQMERGAERIVQSLCAIGPLSDILASGCLAKPHQELLARPFLPIQLRDTRNAESVQQLEQAFIHPWALRFAIARLLGQEMHKDLALAHQRLSQGLRLSVVPQSQSECGPWLVLRSAPAPALDWSSYCDAAALDAPVKALVRAAVQARSCLIVNEINPDPENLWSALISCGLERGGVSHVGWDPAASYCLQALNYRADQDPQAQLRLYQAALASELSAVIAVDHPQPAFLQQLVVPAANHALWLRTRCETPVQALSLTQAAWSSVAASDSDQAPVGLLFVTRSQGEDASIIDEVHEFYLDPQETPQSSLLFERSAQGLSYKGSSPRIYACLARKGITLAPPV